MITVKKLAVIDITEQPMEVAQTNTLHHGRCATLSPIRKVARRACSRKAMSPVSRGITGAQTAWVAIRSPIFCVFGKRAARIPPQIRKRGSRLGQSVSALTAEQIERVPRVG